MKTQQNGDTPLTLKDYFIPFIVRLALLEFIAILGFMLGYVITGKSNDFIPFVMLSQFMFLRYFPGSNEKIQRDLNPNIGPPRGPV